MKHFVGLQFITLLALGVGSNSSAVLADSVPVGNAVAAATAISAETGFGAVELYDESAQMLFWSTIALPANDDGVKRGPGVSCEGHTDPLNPAKNKRHVCRFYYDATGNLTATGSAALTGYSKGLSSVSALIPFGSALAKGFFWGTISIYDNAAQQIFEGMTAVEEDTRGVKRGKRIECMKHSSDKYFCSFDYEGHGNLGFLDELKKL